jgi:glycosyltransferase involved in cell wall biosynthesis
MPEIPSMELPEIRVAGFLNAALGLGETARLIVRSLETVGVPVVPHVYVKSDVAQVPFTVNAEATSGGSKHPGISLISLNGEHLPAFSRNGGAPLFINRYVISVWFWETEELPPNAAAGLPYVDEIWAGSSYIHNVMEKASGGKQVVRTFRHPIDPPPDKKEAARARFPLENRFVFLFTFDYNSCVKRKNPQAACEAFVKAFPEATANGPILIIKSVNGHLHPIDQKLVQWAWSSRPDILFMDGFLSGDDKNLLVQRADAIVSLHRSEGLGLTMLEAMAAGKPTIATAYSGNLTFMTPENAWLIPYEMTEVGGGSIHYPSHHTWAEPNVTAAAMAMREVAAQGPVVQAKSALAKEQIMSRHSLASAGAMMRDLLIDAASRSAAPKAVEFPKAKSWRADAYDALSQLRKMEDTLQKRTNISSRQGLKILRDDTLRFNRQQRKAVSLVLRSLRHHEEQERERMREMRLQLDKLTAQFESLIAKLNP